MPQYPADEPYAHIAPYHSHCTYACSWQQLPAHMHPPVPLPAVPVFFHAFASRGEGSMWVPGRFSLGRWSRPLALVSSVWITFICSLFVLPQVRAAWHPLHSLCDDHAMHGTTSHDRRIKSQ